MRRRERRRKRGGREQVGVERGRNIHKLVEHQYEVRLL